MLIPDVSSYQGAVDWKAVLASGRAGGIVKATESLGYVDPTFAPNWATLGQLGAVRGAYCFAQPAKAVPEATADKFLTVVGTPKPADILVLDLEVGGGDLSRWALTWLDRVLAKTGVRPWLYSYGPFIRAHLTGDRRLADYPLWIAAYSNTAPACPPPWTSYVLWQHTDKANIPGIRTPCDESTGLNVAPGPVPTPKVVVVPQFDPPLRIVAWLNNPNGPGGWGLGSDGGLFALGGAPFTGSAAGKAYFAGRTGAQLKLSPDGRPIIIASSGETYGPDL